MEGLFGILVGAFAIAIVPFVPIVRPVAKAAVMGGLAVAEAAAGAAAVAGHQLDHMRGHAKAEKAAEVTDVAATTVETTAEAATMAEAATTAETATGADAMVETVPATGIADATPVKSTVDIEGTAVAGNDLVTIVGIGPKVASVLAAAGITTLAELAAADSDHLRAILYEAGSRYRAMDPSSWPEQASRLL